MGVALANMNVDSLRDIHPFKQNIAVILVSGIFILLSAQLDYETLRLLEWQFTLFLLAILFLVRPATVLISLAFSKIPWNERIFLAWIAPRGIVAVAIAHTFNYKRDYHIPAETVVETEDARTRQLAAAGA